MGKEVAVGMCKHEVVGAVVIIEVATSRRRQ
jgi:hypothetical protein